MKSVRQGAPIGSSSVVWTILLRNLNWKLRVIIVSGYSKLFALSPFYLCLLLKLLFVVI